MLALLTPYSNAKKSIKLLQTFPLHLHTQNNIRKLREMLNDQEFTQDWGKSKERNERNEKEIVIEEKRKDLDGEEATNCFGNGQATNCFGKDLTAGEEAGLGSKQERYDFLEKIMEEIQRLLVMNDQDSSAYHYKENTLNIDSLANESKTQIFSLLVKIGQDLKAYIKGQNNGFPSQQSNSNCSYNTNSNENANDSNSGSVRSLLTQKLRQFAQEDFEDPQRKNDRVFIQGNLMRQLSKHSRGSKPMVVSRRFQDLSEPFSMQNRYGNQLPNWTKGGRMEQKARVHSQRTILGEINLSESHLKEKRASKEDGGCSRCEIY